MMLKKISDFEMSLFSSISNSFHAPSDDFRNQSLSINPFTEKSLIAQVSSI